jgi:hypothetical protein
MAKLRCDPGKVNPGASFLFKSTQGLARGALFLAFTRHCPYIYAHGDRLYEKMAT